MSVRAIVAAGAIVVLAGLACLLMSERDAPEAPATKPAAAPSLSGVPIEATAPSPIASASDEWSAGDRNAVVAERYRVAKDKRAFFDRAVKVGGSAHLYAAMRAIMDCSRVSEAGMVGAEQRALSYLSVNDPAYAKRVTAFRASISGCEGFETRPVPREAQDALMQRLADSPDPVSAALQMMPFNGQDTSASFRERIGTLLDTGDPYVIEMLLGIVSARAVESTPGVRGDDKRVAAMSGEMNAWQWAMCDLGLDCAPQSPMGLAACYDRGLCDWSSIEQIAPQLFNRGGVGVSEARKDEIVAAVRARDWAKLGF